MIELERLFRRVDMSSHFYVLLKAYEDDWFLMYDLTNAHDMATPRCNISALAFPLSLEKMRSEQLPIEL